MYRKINKETRWNSCEADASTTTSWTQEYIEYIDLLVQFIDTKSRENLDRDREREKQGDNIESYSN